jgi:hypothetical protein
MTAVDRGAVRTVEPGLGPYIVPRSIRTNPQKLHADACSGAVTWEWKSIELPRYPTSGKKRLRLVTGSKGYSVAFIVVSSQKFTSGPPPDLDDIKKLAR